MQRPEIKTEMKLNVLLHFSLRRKINIVYIKLDYHHFSLTQKNYSISNMLS